MPATDLATRFSVLKLFPRAENASISANWSGWASPDFAPALGRNKSSEASATARFVIFPGRNYSRQAMRALQQRKALRLSPGTRLDKILMRHVTGSSSSVLVALIDPDSGDLELNVRLASFYDPDILIFGRPSDKGRIADVAARADRFVASGNLVAWVG